MKRSESPGRTMIAVTCSACRLRFEASAVERRMKGPHITCPACDAEEPVVLDFAGTTPRARLQSQSQSQTKRKKVTPPPLDLSRGMHLMTPQPTLEAEPEPAAPLPIYVDFDEPELPHPSTTARATGFGLAFTGVAIVAMALLAPADLTVRWLGDGAPVMQRAGDLVAGVAANVAPSADDLLTTASITGVAIRPTIARVVTELAETDDGRVLSVRTDMLNKGTASVAAPALRISIRTEAGTVLHRWTASFEGDIEPGETRALTATTKRIPDGAGDVKVDFADR